MAEKYGMLPHQVEQTATTYDFMVMDVVNTYDNYKQQKASGKLMDASVYGLSQDDLQSILDKSNNV